MEKHFLKLYYKSLFRGLGGVKLIMENCSNLNIRNVKCLVLINKIFRHHELFGRTIATNKQLSPTKTANWTLQILQTLLQQFMHPYNSRYKRFPLKGKKDWLKGKWRRKKITIICGFAVSYKKKDFFFVQLCAILKMYLSTLQPDLPGGTNDWQT